MTDYNSHVETQYVFFTLYLYNNLFLYYYFRKI